MGDTTIAQDILDGVADALGDLGAVRKLRIITTPSVDNDNPGATPVETLENVDVDTFLFSFDQEYMPEANVLQGELMGIPSLKDLTTAQITAIKPGNRFVDSVNSNKTYEIVATQPTEVAGVIVTVVVQLKG